MTKTCIAALIACLAAAGGASAQEREKIHIRANGEGVTADFSSVETSTCALGIETTVRVDGSQGVVINNGMTFESNVAAVVVSVYDRCLEMPVLSVTGTGEAEELQVNPNLKTASLRAGFEGSDDYNQPVWITVDLVWNGVNRAERTSDHVNVNQGVYKVVATSSGTIRDAVAGGSVTVDGTDETPLSSTRGTIEKDALRKLIVYR